MGLEEEYNKQLREFRESLVEKARKQIKKSQFMK
jgi:hypothetical protein